MKTAELTGALLDYWVARAEGLNVYMDGELVEVEDKHENWRAYYPSTDWAQGGPLIEKYEISVDATFAMWAADTGPVSGEGDTPLVAICRAVVRSVYGDEVPE